MVQGNIKSSPVQVSDLSMGIMCLSAGGYHFSTFIHFNANLNFKHNLMTKSMKCDINSYFVYDNKTN